MKGSRFVAKGPQASWSTEQFKGDSEQREDSPPDLIESKKRFVVTVLSDNPPLYYNLR